MVGEGNISGFTVRHRGRSVAVAVILGLVAVGGLAACAPGTGAGALGVSGGSIPPGKALCDWATPVIRNNEYSQQFHAVTFAASAAGVQVVPSAGSSSMAASCLFVPVYTED